MRGTVFSWLPLLLFLSESWAVKLAIQRRPQSASSLPSPKANNNSANDVVNINNQVYAVNITLNGLPINVALDWVYSDLWVKPPEAIPSFNDTKLKLKIRYADANAFVSGDIGVGKFGLGQDTVIPLQAFLSVNTDNVGPSFPGPQQANFDNGIFGLWGIGTFSSLVDQQVQTAYGTNATWGRGALANIFALNETGSDYIGLSLSRVGDQADTADGSFTVSEYDSDYQAVANSPRLPYSQNGSWTVPLDGLSVNGKKIEWNSSIEQVPAGTLLVQLNFGAPNILMPAKQIAAIYSSIPGAAFSHNEYLTEFGTNDVWVVPCNASIDLVATFAGQNFPIHPLDLTDLKVVTSPDKTRNFTACIGSITDSLGDLRTDALFGDSFLRNVYTVLTSGLAVTQKAPGSFKCCLPRIIARPRVILSLSAPHSWRTCLLNSLPSI